MQLRHFQLRLDKQTEDSSPSGDKPDGLEIFQNRFS